MTFYFFCIFVKQVRVATHFLCDGIFYHALIPNFSAEYISEKNFESSSYYESVSYTHLTLPTNREV